MPFATRNGQNCFWFRKFITIWHSACGCNFGQKLKGSLYRGVVFAKGWQFPLVSLGEGEGKGEGGGEGGGVGWGQSTEFWEDIDESIVNVSLASCPSLEDRNSLALPKSYPTSATSLQGNHRTPSCSLKMEKSWGESEKSLIRFKCSRHFMRAILLVGPKCLDYRQITHLICVRLKHLLYDFWGGCFVPPSCCFSFIKGPKCPLNKSYSKCFRRTQIRWVIWRSSSALIDVSLWRNPQ